MAGRPGRSGGANKIDPRLHVQRGTFNATRHGAELAALQGGGVIWEPPDPLAQLGRAGRAFVDRMRANFDLNPWEGELVMEAAVAVDRLAQIRETRDAADTKTRLAFDKCEQLWQKQLSALLLSLRVRP